MGEDIKGKIPPQSPGGKIPPRRNITDLMNDEKQWSLYIQALSLLQAKSSDKPLSWFAISGIHGWPVESEWEGGGKKTEDGYCNHFTPTFPTWHRPYLALYDQALQEAAVEAAKGYMTDPDAWGLAALTLRSPYWDWADPATYVPPPEFYDSDKFQNLKITTPSGPTNFPNPLLAYEFPKLARPDPSYGKTVRYPGSGNPIRELRVALTNGAKGLDNLLWNTLTRMSTWNEFSNAGATAGTKGANSLEGLHNTMHNKIGGIGGHMSKTRFAAYDPIFMLHHTNVDRQFALWQALHPKVWIVDKNNEKELRPFRNSNDEFHRSSHKSVRDITEFGATYPEFVGLEGLPEDEREKSIRKKVDALYNSKGAPRGIPVTVPSGDGDGASSDEATIDWFARIRTKAYQLKESFDVYIFLGEAPGDPGQWFSSPHFVGSYSAFVNSAPESCPNCTENADIIIEGIVNLNIALQENGYEQKTQGEIKNFIQEKIDWRIQKGDGAVVPADKLEVFEVAVMTLDVSMSDSDARALHCDITSHKKGGYYPNNQPYELPPL